MNLTGHTLNGLEQTSTNTIRKTCSDRILHGHYIRRCMRLLGGEKVDMSCSTETLAAIFLRALLCDLVLAHQRTVVPSLDVWIPLRRYCDCCSA